MNKSYLPTWDTGFKKNLWLPSRYKRAYFLSVFICLLGLVAVSWNIVKLQGYKEDTVQAQSVLNQWTQSINATAIENKKLDDAEKKFEKLMPLLATRFSVSHILGVIANKDIMPETAYFGELALTYGGQGNIVLGLNLISDEVQLPRASQSLDDLRSGFSKGINVVDKSVALSEFKLTSYNAVSEPVVRSMGKKKITAGYELKEEWTFTLSPIAKNNIARIYDLFSKHMPIKDKK